MLLSCLPSGLQSCFQAIRSFPLYKIFLLLRLDAAHYKSNLLKILVNKSTTTTTTPNAGRNMRISINLTSCRLAAAQAVTGNTYWLFLVQIFYTCGG